MLVSLCTFSIYPQFELSTLWYRIKQSLPKAPHLNMTQEHSNPRSSWEASRIDVPFDPETDGMCHSAFGPIDPTDTKEKEYAELYKQWRLKAEQMRTEHEQDRSTEWYCSLNVQQQMKYEEIFQDAMNKGQKEYEARLRKLYNTSAAKKSSHGRSHGSSSRLNALQDVWHGFRKSGKRSSG